MPMSSYSMYLTVDHRLECTKAKVQVTSMGETRVFYAVEEPEFLSPRSCFNELLHAVEEHLAVVKASKELEQTIRIDDAAGA